MKNNFVFLAMISATLSLSAAPTVSNVSVVQDPVTCRYTLSYSLSEQAIVTIETLRGEEPYAISDWAGDVNKLLASGVHSATWLPRDTTEEGVSKMEFKVHAWTPDTPPDYLAVDFAACQTSSADGVRYYASTNDLPHPVVSDYYRSQAMLFRRIPAKDVTFWMGSPSTETGRNAANEDYHQVTLTNDYYLGVFPVTQSQWVNAIAKTYDSKMTAAPMPSASVPSDRDDSYLRPVNKVSYYDLVLAIGGLNVTNCYYGGNLYSSGLYVDNQGVCSTTWLYYFQKTTGLKYVSIPTDAQWEYACRAGTAEATYDSETELDKLAWYSGNANGETHPVGLKQPNAWGLYDMLGNVWEQCMDAYEDHLGTSPETHPFRYFTHYRRVERGGAYDSQANQCRSAARTTFLEGKDLYSCDKTKFNLPQGGCRVLIGIH